MNFGIKRALSLIGVAVIGLSMISSVSAATSGGNTVTASVTGNPNAFNLTVNSAAALSGSVQYDRTNAQTLCGSVGFEVEDGTFENTGWNVQISSTDFSNTSITGVDPISASNLTGNPTTGGCGAIADPTKIAGQAVNGSGCAQANNGNGPLAWVCDANASLSGYGAKVVSTNPNYGNGIYQQTTYLKLNVPAATVGGSYQATVTLTLSHGNP